MSQPNVRALRGATTCAANTADEITDVTQELLLAMLERNGIDHDDVISVLFTMTPDLDAAFPATAARGIGFGDVPLLCASEIDVPGAMPRRCGCCSRPTPNAGATSCATCTCETPSRLRDDLPE